MRREHRDELLRSFLGINAILREEIAAVRRQIEARRAEVKYNPNWATQPRAPRGVPEGGQWTNGGKIPKQRPHQSPPRSDTATPPGSIPRRVPFGPAAAFVLADALLREIRPQATRAQVSAAIRRFHFDPNSARDVLAARAYVWTTYHGGELQGVPFAGAGNERAAQAVMQFERAVPGTLGLAESGDREAQAFIAEVASAAATQIPIATIVPEGAEEQDYVVAMRAAGRNESEIRVALAAVQRGKRERRAARRVGGVAHNTQPLRRVDQGWLDNARAEGSTIPPQVAERLRGRYFSSSDAFKEEFWITVSQIPELAAQFDLRDLVRMRNGGAPIAEEADWYGGIRSYIIHHVRPIGRRGRVYDMSNMVVVTPLRHQTILDPQFHYVPARDGDE